LMFEFSMFEFMMISSVRLVGNFIPASDLGSPILLRPRVQRYGSRVGRS
jgi:hypothetical protein